MILLKGVLTAMSPFLIGNGADENSNRDILRDADGNPFLPGTTLAGVCRHYLQAQGISVQEIFGSARNDTIEDRSDSKGNEQASKISFYDAFTKNAFTCIRDSVHLANKLAVPGGKFDYEIVESGAQFGFRILLDSTSPEILQRIVAGFQQEEIRLGAKTTRGFGVFIFETPPCYLSLNLFDQEDMKTYLDLDADWSVVQTPLDWTEYSEDSLFETIETTLSLESFLFLRDYATTAKVDHTAESKFVDAQTLLNASGNPVIPGTTWAGVFRHHAERILQKSGYSENIPKFLNALFGTVNEVTKTRQKSQLCFKESELTESTLLLNRTRTAIDRFSGSALQTGALFTGRIACKRDGSSCPVTVSIQIRKSFPELALAKSLLTACLTDLQEGFLAIGGNTSIGAGIFRGQKGEQSHAE